MLERANIAYTVLIRSEKLISDINKNNIWGGANQNIDFFDFLSINFNFSNLAQGTCKNPKMSKKCPLHLFFLESPEINLN